MPKGNEVLCFVGIHANVHPDTKLAKTGKLEEKETVFILFVSQTGIENNAKKVTLSLTSAKRNRKPKRYRI